jgi:hypothetical protein
MVLTSRGSSTPYCCYAIDRDWRGFFITISPSDSSDHGGLTAGFYAGWPRVYSTVFSDWFHFESGLCLAVEEEREIWSYRVWCIRDR